MTIAVDFDGTIVEHQYPEIGREKPFAIDTLRRMADDGHRLILWTVREGQLLEEAVQYCKERGLEFYAVNSDFPGMGWSGGGSRKLKADLFIDDCNLGGLPDWDEIYEMVAEGAPRRVASQHHSKKSKRRRHHSGKKSLFRRIVERCRASREKFNR